MRGKPADLLAPGTPTEPAASGVSGVSGVSGDGAAGLRFAWHHYRDSAEAIDIRPASTIKVSGLVAAME